MQRKQLGTRDSVADAPMMAMNMRARTAAHFMIFVVVFLDC
jgi:hypothetical protein